MPPPREPPDARARLTPPRRGPPAAPRPRVARPRPLTTRASWGGRDAISAGVVASLLAAVDVGVAAQPAAAEPLAGASDGPVLVVGATGNTGRRVVEQLRARGVAVRAASRKPEKMRALGLEAAGASSWPSAVLDPESIASAMAGASAVVCCTGFTPSLNFKKDNPAKVDHVGTDNLVAAAGNAKGEGSVKKFVLVTSLLTNARGWAGG